MRALRFSSTGSLDLLQIEDIPVPRPGPGEALVRIQAAAINPSDVKNVQGKMHETTTPRTPGRDFAGIVTEGSAIWNGRSVFGTGGNLGFGRDGTHAEYVVIPEHALVARPNSLTPTQAAAVGLGFLTAWSALIDAAELQPGETILITGVTGSVGSAAAQIAKAMGARVLGVVRTKSSAGMPRSVSSCIALDQGSLPEQVKQITEGKGASVVFDAVGGPLFDDCLHCLSQRGRQIAIASAGGPTVSFHLVDFYHREARLIGVDTLKLSFAEASRILQRVVTGFESGAYTPPEVELHPFDQVIDCYRAVADGVKSKIVITP